VATITKTLAQVVFTENEERRGRPFQHIVGEFVRERLEPSSPRSRTEAQSVELRLNSGHFALSIQAAYRILQGFYLALR
jgi:hypothetical protein